MELSRKKAIEKVAPRLSHIADMEVPKKIKWIKDLVHEIYDSFDKELLRLKKHDRAMRDNAHKFNSELQAIKKRTCENCKYDNFSNARCDLKRHIPEYYLDGFSCSRWESN